MKPSFRHLFLSLLLLLSLSLQAQQKTRVACVGNSVTYGMRLENRETECYPAQLQQLLGDAYEVRNFGHNGATLLRHGHNPYVDLPEYADALAFRPDVVVIHLGLNDTDPRNWPDYADEFNADYTALINAFREHNKDVKVYVCLLTPIHHRHPRFRSSTRDWHYAIRQHIRQVAEANNAVLIDLYEPLHARTDLFPDALHPNAEGAGIIARTVCGMLTGNHGGLRLPVFYGDGMVLQRHRPVRFFGTANAGDRVKVVFNGKRRAATADLTGRWSVEFASMEAGGPYEASISTPDTTLQLRDIRVGEVWICSGQSNMEMPVSQTATAKQDIDNATAAGLVHIYNMKARYVTYDVQWDADALNELNNLRYTTFEGWQKASPEVVAGTSSVGYHFALSLADSLRCPIGIVVNAIGGATTESYIDRETLEWEFPEILYDWATADYGQQWARERMQINLGAATNPLQRHPYEPCYLFEAAMQPLQGIEVRGVVWYQGESNAHNIELHERLFSLLEQSWRRFLHQPRLPFFTVQLSSLNRPSWPAFRNSQRNLALSLPNTYMAVTSDVGDSLNVHYPQKATVGERVARQALGHIYGRPVETDGPVAESALVVGSKIKVFFTHAKGLRAKDGRLIGFEVADKSGIYCPAVAEIRGETVVLSSKKVEKPVSVRYGWQPFTRANLINAALLPASTFELQADNAE